MKIIRKSNEDEVVLNFLTGELESVRFNVELKKTLKYLNLSETIIKNANLNDKKENILRKEILGEFRGYGKNVGLFENFPKIESYTLCQFSAEDLKNIYYINYSYWNELSNHTSSPLEAAKNIINGKDIFNISNEPFIKGTKLLEKGENFIPMIFLTCDNKRFIVLEGHSRITIYALRPKYFNNIKCFVLKCAKDALDKWNSAP